MLEACPRCGTMGPTFLTACKFCGARLAEDRAGEQAAAAPVPAEAPVPAPEAPASDGAGPPPGTVGPSTGAPPGPSAGTPQAAVGGWGPAGAPARSGGTALVVGAVVGVVVLFALTLTLVVLTSGASRSRTSRQGSATGPELAWISYNTPDGTLRFDLPAQPDIVEADAQGNSTRSRYVVSVANASYSVSTHDYPQGFGGVGSEAWLNGLPAWFAEDVGGTVRTSSRTTVQRKPAIRYDVVGGDGRRWYVTDVFLGTRLLRLSVSGPDATTANLDHMAGSLAFLDPTAPATTTASPP